MGEFAHFERTDAGSLRELYFRHAEVAREIHQDTLREFTGNDTLVVDLINDNLLFPKDTKTIMNEVAKYDVVSQSMEIALGGMIRSNGIRNYEYAHTLSEELDQPHMPVLVVAAGNSGETGLSVQHRAADFARTSLVVGEANLAAKSGAIIEDHSALTGATLATDNPMNRGVKYQFYNMEPDLTGHEDLIREWLADRDWEKRVDALVEMGEEIDTSSQEFSKLRRDHYNSFEDNPVIEQKIQEIIEHPKQFHVGVIEYFRKSQDIDENGFTKDVDGTSFSGPEQAGYISGAIYEQELREEQGLPVLSREEIISIAKMATTDVLQREGNDPMTAFNNKAGQGFTVAGGLGVFNAPMYRHLLDHAYEVLQTSPEIDRESVHHTIKGVIDNGDKYKPMTFELPDDQKNDIIIDRARYEVEFSVNGSFPNSVYRISEGQAVTNHRLANIDKGPDNLSWMRDDMIFGETFDTDQKMQYVLDVPDDTQIISSSLDVYGYNKGGFIDQMMDYATDVAPQFGQPSPVENNLDVSTTNPPPVEINQAAQVKM